jgi:ribonuclease PH
MTHTEQVTHDGRSAIKVTCDCATHDGHGNAALITGAAGTAIDALRGTARDERIHGFVLMANHPAKAMRVRNAHKGILPA